MPYTGTVPTFLAGELPDADKFTEITNFMTALAGAWTAYTPTWTSTGTQPVLNNGTLVGAYLRVGAFVVCRGRLDMGSSTTFGTGTYNFALPVAFASNASAGVAWLSDASGQSYPAAVAVFGSNLFLISQSGNVTNTVPFTWVSTDNLAWTLIYEAA